MIRLLAALALVLAFTTACAKKKDAVSNDIDRLGKLIHLPARPASVSFETIDLSDSRALGPTDWYLMASLSYSGEQIAQITAQSKPATEPGLLDKNEIRPWFSPALKANWIDAGAHLRSAASAYQATVFYKGTLHDGYFVAIPGSNEIFLYMQCCTAFVGK